MKKYITLHQTEADYNSLVLDESNTPHVAYVVETSGIVYKKKIKPTNPDGYELFSSADGEFLDANNDQIYTKIN